VHLHYCGFYNLQYKNFRNTLRGVQPAIQKNFKNELWVVEPTMYFYKIFWLVGSITRNVKILRKYIAGSRTSNVFEKKFTLRVVEPVMCSENVFFL